jgi:hypothetical protein
MAPPLVLLSLGFVAFFAQSVMYSYIHSLLRKNRAAPTNKNPARLSASRKKSCVIILSDFDKGSFFGNQGEVSRRLAC